LLLLFPTLVLLVAACGGDEPAVTPAPSPDPVGNVGEPTGPPPRTFTLVGSGDILLHEGLWTQAQRDNGGSGYSFDKMFASVEPLVSSADLAICHLETPLGEPNGPFSGYPVFNGPPQVAATIGKIGYDSCSVASNHSLDQGEGGVNRTLAALDAAGVKHAGMARDQAERDKPNLLEVKGVTVASLSFTFSFNGLSLPSGKPWLSNPLNTDKIISDAQKAREAGADVVIVSLHWGTEYSNDVDSYQLNVAKKLIESPEIDLILGHHAHVVQPVEKYGDKWVVFGMGNQVSNQNRSDGYTRDGLMPRFTFTEVQPDVFRVVRAEIVPIHMWLGGGDKRLLDIPATLLDPNTPSSIRAACAASLNRTEAILGRRGAFADGLVLVGADLA
jgi:poly-gamma-glutamate synthesis protein (capsule biosynthesis protein)